MATTSNYEVYVLEGTRWAFMSRYPGKEREDAMADARQTEVRTGRPTKVVRETYYNELNYSEETIAYMSPNAKGQAARSDARVPRRRHQATAQTRSHQTPRRKAKKHAETKEPIALAPVSDSTFFVRLILVLVASVVIAAGLTATMGFLVNALKNLGVEIPTTISAQIGLYWYGAMFLLTSVALSKAYVPWRQLLHKVRAKSYERTQQRELRRKSSAAPKMSLKPRQPDPFEQAAKEKEKLEVRMLRGDLDVTPDPYDAAEDIAGNENADLSEFGSGEHIQSGTQAGSQETSSVEDKDNANDATAASPVNTEDEKVQTASESESAEGSNTETSLTTPMTEMNTERLYMIRFLGDTVMTLRSSQDQMDPKLRFGVNLYLAGAASVLADRNGLTPGEEKAVLDEALRLIGNDEEMRDAFFDDFDANISDKKNQDVIHAGEAAMIRNLSESNRPSQGLDAILQKWNKPAAAPLPAIENVVLLTYANVSASVGSSGDDYMDRHNRMVRLAIAEHDGKEVRHTGKGIFAHFDNADDAICAAIAMQQDRFRQSKSNTSPPPIRVALVASLEGEGDPELSGNVFSYADTLCRRIGDGQIACDDLVKKTCTIQAVAFDRTIPSAHSGIAERGRATEILWDPVPA